MKMLYSDIQQYKVMFIASQSFVQNHVIEFLKIQDCTIFEIIDEPSSIEQTIENKKPDFAFVYDLEGIELVRTIKSKFQIQTRFIIVFRELTISKNYHLLYSRAEGFLSLTDFPQEYLHCIQKIMNGERFISKHIFHDEKHNDSQSLLNCLSSKELQIFSLLGDSLPIKEIAEKLFISPNTVQAHRTNIIKKLNLNNAKELRQISTKFVNKI